MNLDDLIADTRTSLDKGIRPQINTRDFRRDVSHLLRFKFWTGGGDCLPLWNHQKAAIGTVVAYLNGDKSIPERPDHKEAALLKLPTGTGKSGIIAVIARCLPKFRKILVLTPRTALTDQLLRDIRYRFWEHLGYQIQEGDLFTALKAEFGADLEDAYTETLLPSRCPEILEELDQADRTVLVGTHQALSDIRESAFRSDKPCRLLLEHIKTSFDLVIVDEGHYEPAVSWSRGVRDFNLPTLLFSATPYRNDYKSFRVRGRYVFNYPYEDAVRDSIIRPVQIVNPGVAPEHRRRAAIEQFVRILKKRLPPLLRQAERWLNDTPPKIMVRGDALDTLELLQAEIDRVFKTQSVLIHDRAKKTRQNDNRFTSVASAIRARGDAQFWIHQYKLMEGIDDPCFVALAIFDLMGTARQLVQQIGRVTRYSKASKQIKQNAWILASPANAERIQTSWNRYVAFEQYVASNTALVVTNEVALPDRLLEHMADYQYIGGEFRGRFDHEAPLAATDIQIPLSAVVLRLTEPLTDLSDLMSPIEEAIMDKDRFKITPIEQLPQNAIGFSYYAWRNSPYLVDRFFSEWKLGIFIAVKHRNLVFMHDTEGLVLDMGALGLQRAGRSLIEKVFPDESDGDGATSRLTRMSYSSLEMSQQAIRSMAIRTRSFKDVFTDLLDPSLVPATAFGFVKGIGRYAGFASARLREAADRYVSTREYFAWTLQVAKELEDGNRRRSRVFERYATVVNDISRQDAQPVSILLDPSQDTFIDMREDEAAAAAAMAQQDIDYDDVCAEVNPRTGEFVVRIGNDDVSCSIEYQEKGQKYRLRSQRLNELFPVREGAARKQSQTLVQRLNQAQAFRVLVERPGIVYSEGRFYEPRLRWVTNDGEQPVLDYMFAANSLANVESEKGEAFFRANGNDWYRRSIFGVFAAAAEARLHALGIQADELTEAISTFPIWLCDDDSREITDFIGIDDEGRRFVFVHAKMGNLAAAGAGFNVPALQAVGRQALASLGFLSRGEPSPTWTSRRWNSTVQANAVRLRGRNRIFKNSRRLTSAQLNTALYSACRNPSFDKEIWIVGANMTRRQDLSAALAGGEPYDNRLRQFLMHWDALQTACARANVRLKFYCS